MIKCFIFERESFALLLSHFRLFFMLCTERPIGPPRPMLCFVNFRDQQGSICSGNVVSVSATTPLDCTGTLPS